MIDYIVTGRFRSKKPIDFTKYSEEFKDAINKFNMRLKGRGNYVLIELHRVSENNFKLKLHSKSELIQPGKALAKLTAALIEQSVFNEYVINKTNLVRYINIKIDKQDDVEMTDGELLISLITLIHNTDCCAEMSEINKRRQLLAEIKRLIISSEIVVIQKVKE